MTLIEELSDEVFHVLIGFFVIGIVSFAWWTTNINDQRYVRTVLLLERNVRHTFHRRLTNHTEAVTISEGTSDSPSILATTSELPAITEQSSNIENSPEPSTTSSPTAEIDDLTDSSIIINAMDTNSCDLRHRRLYADLRNDSHDEEPSTSRSGIFEPSASSRSESGDGNDTVEDKEEDNSGLTIKLKYINDDIRIVEGTYSESLDSFKKRHFEQELSSNKLIRLIFNGQVLQPDSQTLKKCGLFDNCVVHCLVHPIRQSSDDPGVIESRSEGYSFPSLAADNSNQNREWDLGNFLFAFISLMLLAAWYFRYVYAHLYTVTATVGLILITGIFTIVLVGIYLPDENFPNPAFHIRERVVTDTVPPPRQ